MAAPPKNWLVDEDGKFNPNIEQVLNLARENCPIAAVSIIGAQNTGKSTLLNKCFSTNFQVMDESQGITQTTKGIWIAKGPSLNGGPKILLIDIEGSDSAERAQEGDDSFEKKSAAFALAMSNTMIINVECKSVGRHNGAGWPLLKTVFQVMLLGEFTGTPRKVLNLMFVLRDKTGSPLSILKNQLKEGLDKIWEEIWQGISRSEANREAKLEEYFKVEVMTMSNYVLQREEFDKDVKGVKKLLSSLVKDGPTCPVSKFLDDAKEKWDDIQKNEILKLNLNKAADILCCQNIMKEKSKNFLKDKEWRKTETAVGEYASKNGTKLEGFGKRVNSIMDKYLSQYDKETLPFDESIRNVYRNELKEKLSKVVEPSYLKLVEIMREETLEEFVKELVKEIAKEVESGGGKLENINSDNFFDKFEGVRLKDAHVELATWNHTSSQVEKMKSELDSRKKYASNAMEQLTTLKESDVTMLVESAKLLGYVGSCFATLLAPPIAGIGAFGLVAASPVVIGSIQSICQAISKRGETNKQIDGDRGEEGVPGQLWRGVARERSQIKKGEKKDRK